LLGNRRSQLADAGLHLDRVTRILPHPLARSARGWGCSDAAAWLWQRCEQARGGPAGAGGSQKTDDRAASHAQAHAAARQQNIFSARFETVALKLAIRNLLAIACRWVDKPSGLALWRAGRAQAARLAAFPISLAFDKMCVHQKAMTCVLRG
jgi:hypothetical protein